MCGEVYVNRRTYHFLCKKAEHLSLVVRDIVIVAKFAAWVETFSLKIELMARRRLERSKELALVSGFSRYIQDVSKTGALSDRGRQRRRLLRDMSGSRSAEQRYRSKR